MKKVTLASGIVMVMALCSQAALLSNSGFESNDLNSWITFGQDWRIGSGNDAHTGSHGIINDILTTNVDDWRGVYQEVPVVAGKTYGGGVWVRGITIGNSEAFFEVQFLNLSGVILSQHQSDKVTINQDFTFMGIQNLVAPPNTVTASIRGIVFMRNVPLVDPDMYIFDDFEFKATTGFDPDQPKQ